MHCVTCPAELNVQQMLSSATVALTATALCSFEDKVGHILNLVYTKTGLKWAKTKFGNTAVGRTLFYGANYDVHSVVDENHKDFDKSVVGIWENAEVFDWRTERLFRYVQVRSPPLSCLVVSLALKPLCVAFLKAWPTAIVRCCSTIQTAHRATTGQSSLPLPESMMMTTACLEILSGCA